MGDSSLSRRRFFGVAAAVVGGGLVGAAGWLTRSTPDTQAATATSLQQPSPSPTTTTVRAPALAPSTTTTAASTTTTTVAPIPVGTVVDVIGKDAWGALPVTGEFVPHEIVEITVHHTAVVLGGNDAAPSRARQHQRYHQELGWPDLAYHYLIDSNGHVYQGRPVAAVGDTATNYDPTGHLLVCCEGDFNKEQLPDTQYEALVTMLAWGAQAYGVDPANIRGHRDVASTTCPGDNLYAWIADGRLHADVESMIASGPVELVLLEDVVARDLITQIEAG